MITLERLHGTHWRVEPVGPAALLPPVSHPELNVLCSTLFILVYSNTMCVSVRSQTVGWTLKLCCSLLSSKSSLEILNEQHVNNDLSFQVFEVLFIYVFIYFLRYCWVILSPTKDRLSLLRLFLFQLLTWRKFVWNNLKMHVTNIHSIIHLYLPIVSG